MAEYRVKSGQNLPGLSNESIPSLPKLGALQKKPSLTGIPKLSLPTKTAPAHAADSENVPSAPPVDDIAASFEATADSQLRQADASSSANPNDIMSAINGIDGWDDISTDDNDPKTDAQAEVLTPEDIANDLNLTAASAGFGTGSLPDTPAAPSIQSASSLIDEMDYEDGATIAMPAPIITDEQITAASAKATAPKLDVVIPPEAIPSPSEAIPAPPEPAIPPAPQISVPSAPRQPTVPSAPQQPAAVPPAAPPPPAAPQPAAPPPAAPQQPAAPQIIYEEEEEELSDEEQFQALLNSMTPTERAQYEAHCAEERVRVQEEQRQRQREFQQMLQQQEMDRKSAPVGLIVAIIVIVALAGFAVYMFASSSGEEEKTEETAEKAAPAEDEPIPDSMIKRAKPLNTYSVNVDIKGATSVFVNGVRTQNGEVKFVRGRRNSVIGYASGMLPYFKTFGPDETVDETVTAALEPDTLYNKGSIKFRMAEFKNVALTYKAAFDGSTIANFPHGTISDVVLGRPHILTLEAPGVGKHMHIIWPDDRDTLVTIPELRSENDARIDTECTIKEFPSSASPYGLTIITGEQKAKSPIVAHVLPGDMIEYYVTRKQRQSLQVAIIPEGFGTLALDTSLLKESLGESMVSFNRTDKGDYRICLRRVGTVICPSMTEPSPVPSGNDWEMFAVTGSETNPTLLHGSAIVKLSKNRKHSFDVALDAQKSLTFKTTRIDKIKTEK